MPENNKKDASTNAPIITKLLAIKDFNEDETKSVGAKLSLFVLAILAVLAVIIFDKFVFFEFGFHRLEGFRNPIDRAVIALTVLAYGIVVLNTIDYFRTIGKIDPTGQISSNQRAVSGASRYILASILISLIPIGVAVALGTAIWVSAGKSVIQDIKFCLMLTDVIAGLTIFASFWRADHLLLNFVSHNPDGDYNQEIDSFLREQIQFIDMPGFIGFSFILVLTVFIIIAGDRSSYLDVSSTEVVAGLKSAVFGATAFHIIATQFTFNVLEMRKPILIQSVAPSSPATDTGNIAAPKKR